MAKSKNVVKKTKGTLNLVLILVVALGWLMAAGVILSADDAVQEQNRMIAQAQTFLEDKLYIRAVNQYKTALATYETDNNPVYETELLNICKDAGMMDEYYALVEERMEKGAAQVKEYLAYAEYFLEKQSVSRAMEVLQKGIDQYQDMELISLYESICYEYSPSSTIFTQVKMPSGDWYVPAFDGEKWGYVGTDGKTLLAFSYEDVTRFSGSYAVVKLNGTYTLIDKNGYWNAVDKNGLDQVTSIAGTRIVGVKDGSYGIYTNTFNKLSSEAYEDVLLNDNGLILVKKGGKWAILDNSLNAVTDFIFTDVAVNSKGQVFNGNFGIVADENGYYLINSEGNAYFEGRFPDAKGMEGGLFAVADASGKWGFANEKGEVVVECQYEDARSFSDRLAAVKYAGRWGYINQYNTWIIEPEFTEADPFLEGNALVTDDLGCYRVLSLRYYEDIKN